ncbi:MAG: 4-oxalomesaconate tautomerase, partial [Alphaproteobacteria bacterium]|nr:4-oxalomesaconate tautomerase [Alphaproteobacteria bacterium]
PAEASLRVRSFIRSVWQPSTDRLAALSVSAAALYRKSVLHHLTPFPEGLARQIKIISESGQINVLLELNPKQPGIDILRAGFIQTIKPV